MGEAVARNSEGISGKPESTAGAGTTNNNSSTGRTEPPRTGADNRTGAGTGTGTGTKTEPTEKPTGVVDVTEQQKAEARRQQKAESARRAQARREAIEKGEPIPEWAQVRTGGSATRTPKPKAKAKEPEVLDAAAIQKLIKTVFDLIATRPNAGHWKLSDEECKQLAIPLADILSEYAAASQALSQNSKYIALVMAAFAICAPRVMLSMTMKKMRKEAEHGITAKPKREIERKSAPDTAGKATTDSRNNTGTTAANGADDMPNLFDLVSTI